MRLQLRKPFQTLDKAYARQAVSGEKLDTFCRALAQLMLGVDEKETDEYQTALVARFLNDTFSAETYEVSTALGVDLIVCPNPEKAGNAGPSVVIETRKAFAGEMITPIKNNVKSLHELILYYFDAQEVDPTRNISQLIITDAYNWFIFDETDFRSQFYENPRLRKLYQLKRQHQKDNAFFYAETARILRELNTEIPVTYLNLREVADALKLPADQGNRVLIPVYKLLAPDHLLNSSATGKTNPVHPRFYDELLHIIGVQEAEEKSGKRLCRLPEKTRLPGSLIELVIERLVQENRLFAVPKPEQYGATESEQLINVALALAVNWLNRILFLKLAESQINRYRQGNQSVELLTGRSIETFSALDGLFSDVASNGKPWLPGWMSSLFGKTDLEQNTLSIRQLPNEAKLPLFAETVLTDSGRNIQSEQVPTLHYLLHFLDSYAFSVDTPALIELPGKPHINAAALLHCWDRLSACRRGMLPAPAVVTNYAVREAIRRAAISRFNEQFEWNCVDLAGVQERLTSSDLTRANDLIDSFRILDPAVGGGAFLSAALNELIVLKAELGILRDLTGRPVQSYGFAVIDNALLITTSDNEPFDYFLGDPNSSRFSGLEIQRIQETILREKQTLIANCLFGVDTDRLSVSLCRWRFAIDLLKSVYWSDLEASGNPALSRFGRSLEWNTKIGNALLSGFSFDFRVDSLKRPLRDTVQKAFKQYRTDAQSWKRGFDTDEGNRLELRMRAFRELLAQIALADQKDVVAIRKLEAKLAQAALTFDVVAQSMAQQKLTERLHQLKKAFENKQQLLSQAFEWRFEFPEVLDTDGNFVGFDVIVGCPPTAWHSTSGSEKGYYQKAFLNTYTAKANPYVLFVELGLRLLKADGQLAVVLPANWVKSGNSSKLRQWLKTKAIEQITDFADQMASNKNAVRPGVLIVRNAGSTGTFLATKIDTLSNTADVDSESITVFVDTLADKAWALSGNNAS
ncbi:Eco57I restriction-modification methylase domain-containing protein [Spirosoma sp. SC4-14]|uniref:DUF7149 domain-containing protein n=1 Tax=Spirosoma sp. SC4-14 TaxID=3128900 RepID=UPI0030D131CB